MGNAGRNGGEYYTPRPLIRAIEPSSMSLLTKIMMTRTPADN